MRNIARRGIRECVWQIKYQPHEDFFESRRVVGATIVSPAILYDVGLTRRLALNAMHRPCLTQSIPYVYVASTMPVG